MSKKDFIERLRKNKQAVWIRCTLCNGEEFNCENFDEWMGVKERCQKEHLFPKELTLQFRSHEVPIDIDKDDEGLYIIRSAMGKMGQKTKNYITIGRIKDGVVHKKMFLTPELIVKNEYQDLVENCFEEAILYDETKKNREKQV